ncbi:MAG TPA: MoxR family ATPase [Candidatus Methylacidiphilales bacterium]|nr:MoxR family ATPase [Candidatus Methylacidiphilales bacterium]
MNSILAARAAEIRQEVKKIIIGQETLVEKTLIALLAGGHVILEGVPGLAKTLFARALAASLRLKFKRIQFTPDLMPSDLIGTNVFQPDTHTFKFLPGPLFADILLADEINRTPPKTQSALLEAMEEHQATVDGMSYPLPAHFFVIATQNPIEYEGTFPLPEAQTDRFLFKIKVDYPTPADELLLLQQSPFSQHVEDVIQPRAAADDFTAAHREIEAVTIDQSIYDYTLRLLIASRQSPQLTLGASPRAGRGWIKAARVLAALRERNFVTPDDIKELAYPILRHRLVRKAETEIEGTTVEQVIDQLLASVEVPR